MPWSPRTRRRSPRRSLLAACLGVALAAGPATAQGIPVELELVLALDASASVSDAEFSLQVGGLADAFRDRAVGTAIRASGDLGLAIAVIQWSDNRQQQVAVDWTLVRGGPEAERLAKHIDGIVRRLGGNTAIGSALEFATAQLESNAFAGRRRIIDISGDGPNNQGNAAYLVRRDVIALGITINALAILNEDPTLDRYYRSNVIGGSGAFVMTANDYEAYRDAILAKLVREIAGAPTAGRPRPGRATLAARD